MADLDPARPGRIEMINPEFELLGAGEADSTEVGRIVPIYEAIGGISSRMMRRIVYQALETFAGPYRIRFRRRCWRDTNSPRGATPSASFTFRRRPNRWPSSIRFDLLLTSV